MTRKSRRLLPCLILILCTVVACNKVADYLRSNKDGDIKYCNIKKIRFLAGSYTEARAAADFFSLEMGQSSFEYMCK